MKKGFPILLIIAILGLILQVVITIFITDKSAEYVILTEDNEYKITESLEVVDDVSFYDFSITDKNGDYYLLSMSDDFNKQSEIILDVKYFKSNEVTCIFPIYRRDKTGDVSCLYKGETVSYSYLKQINNVDIDSIVSKLKEENYNHNSWDRKVPEKVNMFSDSRGIDVYQDNILEDYIFIIWRYKGIYLLKHDKSLIKDYIEYDVYDNTLSALVGKYYVSAVKRTNEFRISELVYYNTKDLGKGKIELLDATSNNFYFNGVYKDKLYMTDVGVGKQYAIDPKFEKVTIAGSSQSDFMKVANGKVERVKAEEFLAEPVYFTDTVSNEKISAKYGIGTEIYKDRNFYYFRTSDGSVYRTYEKDVEKAELLFKFSNLVDWKVINGDIMAVAGDTVYLYTDDEGLIPIAVNSELNYNHKNIVDFWKK